MNPTPRPFITIVSGLPRSGTSLAMQMLHAGGVPALTDQLRTPDTDNPRGYFEFERVKHLKTDHQWLDEAVGKAVKVIHLLVTSLPPDRPYRVLMMLRDVTEVVQSQTAMLARSGKPGGGLKPERLAEIFTSQMATVKKWLTDHHSFQVLDVKYPDLIRDPRTMSRQISDFLGGDLGIDAMVNAVDPSLYRQRAG